MSRKDFWRFPVVAVVLVGLVVGTCVAGLAEASSATDQVCGAVKGEELSSSKTPSPSLWAVPIEQSVLPLRPSESRCSTVDLPLNLVLDPLRGDLSPRAPPTLL